MLNSSILEGYVITVRDTLFILKNDEVSIDVIVKKPIHLANGQNIRAVGRLKTIADKVCFSAEHIELRNGITTIVETEELEI